MESHKEIEKITQILLKSNSVKDRGMFLEKDYILYLKEKEIINAPENYSSLFFNNLVRNVVEFVD